MTSSENTLRLSAVEAIAQGLRDGGGQFISNFPGFHSHEVFELCGGTMTSVNEQTAFATAWGAAFAGRRSAVTLKNVGLNASADAFLNAHLLSINAGLTVVVMDDIDVAGSQGRFDSRHYFDFFGGLWFEPRTVSEAYDVARESFALSEVLEYPVVIRVTNRLLARQGRISRSQPITINPRFRREPAAFVVHPTNSIGQQMRLQSKSGNVEQFVEQLYSECWQVDQKRVRIEVGCPSLLVPEGTEAGKVAVFTYPLPMGQLQRLVDEAEHVEVDEHGDPFVLAKIRALMNPVDSVTAIDDVAEHEFNYGTFDRYKKLFEALRSFDDRLVVGDVGDATMDEHRTIDACLCLGASVATAVGCKIAAPTKTVFCVTGDGAFCHSGRLAFDEANERGTSVIVIVIENGGSGTTGGQRVPGWMGFCRGEQILQATYDDTSVGRFRELLKQCSAMNGPSLIVVSCQPPPYGGDDEPSYDSPH